MASCNAVSMGPGVEGAHIHRRAAEFAAQTFRVTSKGVLGRGVDAALGQGDAREDKADIEDVSGLALQQQRQSLGGAGDNDGFIVDRNGRTYFTAARPDRAGVGWIIFRYLWAASWAGMRENALTEVKTERKIARIGKFVVLSHFRAWPLTSHFVFNVTEVIETKASTSTKAFTLEYEKRLFEVDTT